MLPLVVLLVGALLAFANGANDNFKGVATLLGSGTTSHKRALVWATVTTALGSLTALVLARGLLAAFAGKGLVPPAVVADPVFPAAVAFAAGLTVLLASRLGFPISTTHALIGALIGAGLLMSPTGIDGAQLSSGFLLPLLTSPFLAITATGLIYPVLRFVRKALGVTQETCVCVGERVVGVATDPASGQRLLASTATTLDVGETATCRVRYGGRVVGVSARPLLDLAHFASAGAVSFARGLNDTPKIAALLLVGNVVAPDVAIVAVGLLMAIGGVQAGRRVAQTMATGVTAMNPGQGFTGNLVTSTVVIASSSLGLPVSTTHVSCGALFGIGVVTGGARWKMILSILAAWAVTLPLAAVLAALFVLVAR